MAERKFLLLLFAVAACLCPVLIESRAAAEPPAAPAGTAEGSGDIPINNDGVVLKRVSAPEGSGSDGSGAKSGKDAAEEKVSEFRPEDHRQLFFVDAGDVLKNVVTRWIFVAVNTSSLRNQKIFETSDRVTGKYLNATLNNPQAWPIGEYEAEIFVDDKPFKRFSYKVLPEKPVQEKIAVGDIVMLKNATKESRGETVEAFRPVDRVMHFEVTTRGVRSVGTPVKWAMTAVDTEAGRGIKVAEYEIPQAYFENTTLSSVFSLPRDWPKGRYEVDLFVENQLAAKREFFIQ